MGRLPTIWKANIIAFISSFCVMVIELIAVRILAPYIGVSLYTWTSIIGIILAGIALGNYLGGKLADKRPSPILLMFIFFTGALTTIGILPATKFVAEGDWFSSLPVMWNFTLKTSLIFFLPAVILSMVSPMVIKLTLADLGRTGGVVGTIYAFSTAGSILGTFLTGFYLILWLGTAKIVWLVSGVLIFTGIIAWLAWASTKWKLTLKNIVIWTTILGVIIITSFLYQWRHKWEQQYTMESNYYAIRVIPERGNVKILSLDDLIHSYVDTNDPTNLVYDYLKVFASIIKMGTVGNPQPRVLHLGAGGYSFPRYMEITYAGSINEVVEIDPAVTQISYRELGLPPNTTIKTYNMDARQFFIQHQPVAQYDIIIGDVFNGRSTPYHLTTLEFDQIIKESLKPDGIYLINIIDDYHHGRYMPSLIYTLKQVFKYVSLFNIAPSWENADVSTYVILATDHNFDFSAYKNPILSPTGKLEPFGHIHDEARLDTYLTERKAVLLTDDYTPTDIFIAAILAQRKF